MPTAGARTPSGGGASIPSAPPAAAVGGVSAATAAGAIAVAKPTLFVSPGQLLAARVLAAAGSRIELAIAGGRVSAESSLPLTAGESLRLVVAEASTSRIVLREAPGAAPGTAQPTALTQAGLPQAAARALLAASAELGLTPRSPAEAAALGTRAVDAGVGTPAEAAAFARLTARGLPASAGSVGGLAQLVEGTPIGRALAIVVSLAGQSGAGATSSSSASSSAAAPPLPGQLVETLRATTQSVATHATDGDADSVRRAITELGGAGPGRESPARASEAPSVRAVLLAIATHPAADATLARAAATAADAIGAQTLAAPSLPSATQDGGAGAYLQLPMPDGGTAEVHVAPDEGGDGGEGGGKRARRVAFLLHLSALGTVMIDAATGRDGVDAVVRVATPDAQRFAASRSGDLERGLREVGSGSARVSVEHLGRGATTSLLPAPPASGVDVSA